MRLQQSLQASTRNALDAERASRLAQAIYWRQQPLDFNWSNGTASSLMYVIIINDVLSLPYLHWSASTQTWTYKEAQSPLPLTRWRNFKRSIQQWTFRSLLTLQRYMLTSKVLIYLTLLIPKK